MSNDTFAAHNGSRAFHASSAHRTERGTRIYWAATALYQDTPDGRYEIEKLHSSLYVITHHQGYPTTDGGTAWITRRVGQATTKGVAVRYAEIDHEQLADKVVAAIDAEKEN